MLAKRREAANVPIVLDEWDCRLQKNANGRSHSHTMSRHSPDPRRFLGQDRSSEHSEQRQIALRAGPTAADDARLATATVMPLRALRIASELIQAPASGEAYTRAAMQLRATARCAVFWLCSSPTGLLACQSRGQSPMSTTAAVPGGLDLRCHGVVLASARSLLVPPHFWIRVHASRDLPLARYTSAGSSPAGVTAFTGAEVSFQFRDNPRADGSGSGTRHLASRGNGRGIL
jgi:hypothetical protein